MIALASSAIYLFALLAVEWPFADFLMSPASRNAFFGTTYFYYGMPPTSSLARNVFEPSLGAGPFTIGLLIALLLGTLAMRWGCSCGNWFKAVKR